MGIPEHLTCLLRNLYTGQEATVRILYGTTDWFKIEKGVQQGCLLSSCLFNLYTEHIMWNAGLDDLKARIKTAGRNISNLRYFRYVGQSVQLLSHVWLFATPWTAALQASQSVTNSRSLFNSNPSSRWCHRTISSSVIPFSSCLQSFPASGSFLTSQFFASGGQRFGISASASVLPLNIQD